MTFQPRVAVVLTILGCTAWSDAAERTPFIVHEWGVMVTGRNAAGQAELAPPNELIGGLPNFVLRHEGYYKPRRQDHGWDKPVIHFYGTEGLGVEVRVGVPKGRPIAYWPAPTRFEEKMGKMIVSKKEMMVYTQSEVTAMVWSGTLLARPAREPAEVAAAGWWAGAREVPGMWLNTLAASERFIFYEATAEQEPAIRTTVRDDSLTIQNTGGAASGPVLVLINDGRQIFGRWVDDIPGKQSTELRRADLLAKPWAADEVLAWAKRQWQEMGMTEEEARAIVLAWRPDLLETAGFLVIARMPSDLYERMFPLAIAPEPDELVRVGLVFDTVGGQDSRSAWLPGLRARMEEWSAGLTAPDFRQRREAANRFARLGDLARPYLRTLANDPDPARAMAAAELLRELEPTPAKVE